MQLGSAPAATAPDTATAAVSCALPPLAVSERLMVLRWASQLTIDSQDPHAVRANAAPLLAWIDQADSRADRDARMAALRLQHDNTAFKRGFRPDDDPQRLLADAWVLYRDLAPAPPDH